MDNLKKFLERKEGEFCLACDKILLPDEWVEHQKIHSDYFGSPTCPIIMMDPEYNHLVKSDVLKIVEFYEEEVKQAAWDACEDGGD